MKLEVVASYLIKVDLLLQGKIFFVLGIDIFQICRGRAIAFTGPLFFLCLKGNLKFQVEILHVYLTCTNFQPF
jgi:hypothetical protein